MRENTKYDGLPKEIKWFYKVDLSKIDEQLVLGASNTIERAELDMHNWSFTDAYRAADNAGHSFYNKFSDDVTRQINDVANRYSSGSITQDVALREMASIANSSQQTLVDVSSECLGILRNYAASHPNFDLSAVEDAMAYLVAHPNAVANMNEGIVDVVLVDKY